MRAGLFSHEIDILRRTALIVDERTSASSMTPDRQPVRASLLRGFATASGSWTISGTVGGSSDSEVLTYPGSGSKRTTKEFTAVSGTTSSGLGTVSLEAVDTGGQPQHALLTVATTVPATRGEVGAGDYKQVRQGQQSVRKVFWGLDYSDAFTLRPGDLIRERDTLDTWYVESADLQPSPLRPIEWELECRRYET